MIVSGHIGSFNVVLAEASVTFSNWLNWRLCHSDNDTLLWARLRSRRRLPGNDFDQLKQILSNPQIQIPHPRLLFPDLMAEAARAPNYEVRLMTRTIPLAQWNWLAMTPEKFDDGEEFEFVHRFAWLPQFHGRQQNDFFKRSVLSWIASSSVSEIRESAAWNPYCIAERIAHWGLFLVTQGGDWATAELETLSDSLILQTGHLLDRLEYHGEFLTGNHLSNNFRGIFWAGLLLNRRPMMDLALKLISKELRRLTREDGCLREGSTHYHLLITKNYFETMLVNELASQRPSRAEEKRNSQDDDLLDSLMSAADFFNLQGFFPLIGDISPDCTPTWLSDVVALYVHHKKFGADPMHNSKAASGWASLFSKYVASVDEVAKYFSHSRQLKQFRKLEKEDWSVLVHVNDGAFPFLPGHAHQDSLSFTSVFDGREIVVDPGRLDYRSLDMTLAGSHNSVLVDDRSPEFTRKSFMGEGYLRHLVPVEPDVRTTSDGIVVRHHGYGNTGISVERDYRIESGELVVRNRVDGRGAHKVAMILYLNSEEDVLIQWPDEGRVVQNTVAIRNRQYGKAESCVRLQWEGIMELPWAGILRIRAR